MCDVTILQEHTVNKQSVTLAGNLGELLPVPKDYFVPKQVDAKSLSLAEFCDSRGLRKKRLNIFLEESQMVQKPVEVRDVLLMDKVIHV